MRIAAGGSQHEVPIFARLDPKAAKTARSERTSNALKHRRQVSDVDKYVSRQRQIEIPGLRPQELGQVAADQIVVALTLPCGLEHACGGVDPGQRPGQRAKSQPDKTRAATQVQNIEAVTRREAH